MSKKLVSIFMGSDSDLKIMGEAAKKLESLGVGYNIYVSSAHRTLDKTLELVDKSLEEGVEKYVQEYLGVSS